MPSRSIQCATLAATALCICAAHADGFGNGGFETANTVANPPGGAQFFAQSWLAAPTGNLAQWSDTAHTGAHSALLSVPAGFGGSTLFQNSIDQGGMPALTAANVGDTPTLSFYALGDVSPTGNVLFAIRYLGGAGNILGSSGNQFFQGQINTSTWSKVSFQMSAIPVGTQALFLEMTTAVGPLLEGRIDAVYIDDITVTGLTAAVPEPGAWALMLAGLAGVGLIRRRRPAD